MGMIENIKKNGNVELSDLSVKQIIGLLGMWDTKQAKKENLRFSYMLKRCYKTNPWHESSPIIYLNSDENTAATIYHGFYNLDEGDEENVMRAIKAKIEDGNSKK